MYCPDWVFDVAAAKTASEFLAGVIGLESCAQKYATGLSEAYKDVTQEKIQLAANEMLAFLSEVEAGDAAVKLLDDFCYGRMYFETANKPRRLKPLFGKLEDPVKAPVPKLAETSVKSFKAYVFSLRSNVAPKPPAGWSLETDEHLVLLPKIVKKSISPLDSLLGG